MPNVPEYQWGWEGWRSRLGHTPAQPVRGSEGVVLRHETPAGVAWTFEPRMARSACPEPNMSDGGMKPRFARELGERGLACHSAREKVLFFKGVGAGSVHELWRVIP